MENNNQQQVQPVQPPQPAPPAQPYYYTPTPVVQTPPFPTGKRELAFGVTIVILSLLLCNFTLFGGFNLGFAVAAIGCIACAVAYLYAGGCRLDGYSGALLAVSVVIAAGFARSDDGFVKFVMVCFLLLSVYLALGLMAGQNRRDPAGFTSVLDPFRVALMLGLGDVPGLPGAGSAVQIRRPGGEEGRCRAGGTGAGGTGAGRSDPPSDVCRCGIQRPCGIAAGF